MSIKTLRAKWKARRLELAMNQIGNPTSVDELGMRDAMQAQVRATRGTMGALGRLSKTTSKTEWRGD